VVLVLIPRVGARELGPVKIFFEGDARVVEVFVTETKAATFGTNERRWILSHHHIAGAAWVSTLESENTECAAHSDLL